MDLSKHLSQKLESRTNVRVHLTVYGIHYVSILTILKDLMKPCKTCSARHVQQAKASKWKSVLGCVLVWVSMIGHEREPMHIYGKIQ